MWYSRELEELSEAVPHKVVVRVCGMRPLLTLKELLLSSYFEGVSHRPPREFMALILSASLTSL